MKTTPLAIAAAATVLAAPVMASASAHVLFSQSAGTATTSSVHGASGTVSMRTAHKPVLAFEERPGTRTGFMSEAAFSGLWGGSFRTDPPNAILTGVDPLGRNHRVVVRVTRVTRTSDGVRYRMRALRGSLPTHLSPANLMIDSVPISAITAALKAYLLGNSSKVNDYEPIINALRFPMAPSVIASPNIVITAGNPLVVRSPAPSQVITAGQLVFEPGAQMVFPTTSTVSMISPQWPRPCGAPGYQLPPDQLPPFLLPVGLNASVQVVASTGATTDYPGVSLPYTQLTATPLSGGACRLQYEVATLPAAVGTTTFQVGMTFTNTSSQPVVLQSVQISAD